MLPHIRSLEEYRKIYADTEVWLPAAQAIAARHALPGPLQREPLGTHVVFRSGETTTIKIFCTLWPQDSFAERTALSHVHDLPVPSILHEGDIDGWPYLVMKRLPGVPAVTVWASMPEISRRDIIQHLGKWMRDLHRAPVPVEMAGSWDAFIRERIEKAEAHHDMPEPWLSWIREQLRDFREPPMAHVLLHADLTADHLLLINRNNLQSTENRNNLQSNENRINQQSNESRNNQQRTVQVSHWLPSGLIDFGDAKAGHPFYEFIAPLAFYCFGQPDLSLTLLEAYGLEPAPGLLEILTRYCLLHEFGTIRSFLNRFPAETPKNFITRLWGQY